MRKRICSGIACLFVALVCAAAPAEAANQLWEEYDKLIDKRQAVGTLGPDLFGDQLSFYTGSLSFTQTDVSLPGNSALPVAITRTFSPEERHGYPTPTYAVNDFPLGDWDLDLPNISGVFAAAQGWVGADGLETSRCSQPAAPRPYVFGAYNNLQAAEFWHGYHLRLPGGGGGEVLASEPGVARPTTGGPYPWLTADWTYLSCLPSIVNAPSKGQGFLAITADGSKYWFNWMATFHEPQLKEKRDPPQTGYDVLDRERMVLYATRVEDRFGNSVTYTYANASNAPVVLSRIDSSDGRSIVVESNAYGFVSRITAAGRQWTYEYRDLGLTKPELTAVVQPDLRRWELNVGGLSGQLKYESAVPGEPSRSCTDPGAVIETAYMGTMTHPSGAVGEFTIGPKRFGRSNVLLMCNNVKSYQTQPNDPNDDSAHYPVNWDSFALTQKRIYGPGLVTAAWNYDYYPTVSWFYTGGGTPDLPVCTYGDCIQPQCVSDSCAGTSITTVTGPGQVFKRYTFGNSYRYNEGKLQKVETGSGPTNILSTQQTTYELASSGQPFPTPIGISPQARGAGGFISEYLRPQRSTTTTQQGVTFSSTVNSFDGFANPLSRTRVSSLAPGHIDTMVYHNDLAKWVLGQTKTLSTDGIQVSHTEFNTNALPWMVYSFGKLQHTLGYYTDGTLATVKDGRNLTTTLSSWHRGIPRTIAHADATSESATVNDSGWITSVTDENGAGFTRSYGYDPMGRLDRITYPTGDSTAWSPTTLTFEPVAAAEYGIPAGHWRQTVATGNARKVTYFDGMWRPLIEEAYDTANSAATLSQTVKRYDANGRLIYQSYPMRGLTGYTIPTQGSRTFYDALDRVTQVDQDSEIGVLSTKTLYESGFRTTTTNPRLKSTTVSYLAHDQPTMDWPVAISHPEGAYTDIARDPFGKPTSLTRRNAGGTVALSRHYVYDANQQLCKTIEPETASTVMSYDAAGNLDWSASGLSYPSTTSCDTLSVPLSMKVDRDYDDRNRLYALIFPDGNGSQSWEYKPDGLPSQVTTLNDEGTASAINTFSYNKRRMLTGESLQQPGLYTWSIGYGYNGNGHLATHSSPGLSVAYAPNALGQPTQAGAYATGVSYFPNGAMAQFTYGNGIVHTLVQNTRGLPDRSRDAYGATAVHDDSYDYDANANVRAISDGRVGARGNRDMTYDGLDRLNTTASPMFAPAAYTYDVLDNLTTVKVAGRDHGYHYDPSWQLTNVTNALGATVIGLDYDPQGNLKDKNGQLYRFDFGNRLRESMGKEKYRYDAHGRRIQASHQSLDTIYSMYGNDGVLRYQEDYRKKEVASYVYLNGSMVASVTTPANVTPAPTLSAPSTSGNGSFAVSWSTVPGASGYRLEQSINSGAWTQVIDTPALTWSTSGKPNGSYRYRGRSCHLGCSAYSAIVTVTVSLVPTQIPTVTAPSYNTAGSYTVSWTSVALATTYELHEQVNGGAWALVQNTAAYSKAISGKSSGTYGYRVRGCNSAGCASWSTIATVAVELPPAAPPVLTVPAQGLNGAYTVSWGTAAGATSYTLEESVNGGAWGVTYSGTAQSKAFSGRAAASYAYRIKACNPAGCSGVSATGAVQVIYPPATAPVISAPSQGLNGAYTVSWTAVGGATSYRLEESANGAAWLLIQNTTALSRALSGKATGSYAYRVSACNAAGCSPISSSVSVQVIHPPGTATTPTAPALSSNGAYTVSWSAVSTASSYQLTESANGGAWVLIHNATTLSKAVSGKATGSYSYRVRACNAAGCGAESGIRVVQVTHPPSVAPVLTAPTQSTTGAYTVSWTAVSTATSYQLEESANSGTWTLRYNGTAISSALSGKAAGSYSYRVKACNAGGCGPLSAIDTTQVVLAPTASPVVSTPANVAVSSYTVSWSTVAAATSYQLWERFNAGAWTQIVNSNVASKAVSGKANGTWGYQARGCNVAGCGPWSSIASTVVNVPPPIPPMPSSITGERDVNEGTKPIQYTYYVYWTASSGATNYELQDITGTPTIVDYGSDLSYQTIGYGPRTYQVRACNVSGCSAWRGPLSL